MDGESVTIVAYGATGSGKTYTMQGPIFFGENEVTDGASILNDFSGVLPRTAEFIFEELKRLERVNSNQKIFFSAMEIYNENVFDLLDENVNKTNLTVYASINNISVKNLISREINSKKDILKYTIEASKTRRTDSTIFNDSSSRSHAIFQLRIEFFNNVKQETINGLINIVDLAGSEKCTITTFTDKSKEEIENMKKIQNEANNINKSLSTLGRIISTLADKKANKQCIPYRDSKLTTILQVLLI